MSLCVVFCTADIPAFILNAFLRRTVEHLKREYSFCANEKAENCALILTSSEIANVKPSVPPMKTFQSPFLGKTVEEVGDWFILNITNKRRLPKPCMPYCYIVLDQQSVKDGTCVFASIQGGQLQHLRCDFYVAYDNGMQCTEKQSIDEGVIGQFMRSGVIMTRERLKLALDGGLYIEGGEVKEDPDFVDTLNGQS
ncbi:hypothetical protein NLJ89_g9174 [Agrocybe chaxingu]|uniref:Uncharacterized protein n=1 Tax=Agrocybe chaxingu TaxID=84603 RepID=A0A9W8MRH0_9AGAR|nr:hypothetical protein NLJ89_g9174 [Agrocybe chaxingu]